MFQDNRGSFSREQVVKINDLRQDSRGAIILSLQRAKKDLQTDDFALILVYYVSVSLTFAPEQSNPQNDDGAVVTGDSNSRAALVRKMRLIPF